jgi:hypothetical protein
MVCALFFAFFIGFGIPLENYLFNRMYYYVDGDLAHTAFASYYITHSIVAHHGSVEGIRQRFVDVLLVLRPGNDIGYDS